MDRVVVRLRGVYERFAVLPALLIAARYHRYRSNTAAAKARLVRAADLVPTCFKAHLRLGALYLEEHDFYRAKREFRLARELNPGKFRRLYPLITGASGDININLFYFPGFTDREPDRAPEDFLRDFIGEPVDEEDVSMVVGFGDFVNFRELRKFREMGPFRSEEVEDPDWDAVLDRLE